MNGVLQQLDDFQLQTRGEGGCFRLPRNKKLYNKIGFKVKIVL
jgi:hypothetical protein